MENVFYNLYNEIIVEKSVSEFKLSFPNIPEDIFNSIISKDPESKPELISKTADMAVRAYNKFKYDLKDLDKLYPYFKYFITPQAKAKLPAEKRDINRFADVDEFTSLLDQSKIVRTKGEEVKAIEGSGKNIDVIFDDENWSVFVPLSYEAAIKYGKICKATWCTSSSSAMSHYNRYMSQGDLYIFFNKKNPTQSYQANADFDEIRDTKQTETISVNVLKERYVKFPSLIDNLLTERGKEQQNKNLFLERRFQRYLKAPNLYYFLTAIQLRNEMFFKKLLDNKGTLNVHDPILTAEDEAGKQYTYIITQLIKDNNTSKWLKYFDLTKIPKEIIASIAQDTGSSYGFAEGLGFNLAVIPKEIIARIAQDTWYSYRFAEGLEFNLDVIPKEIVNSANRFKSNISWMKASTIKKENTFYNLYNEIFQIKN